MLSTAINIEMYDSIYYDIVNMTVNEVYNVSQPRHRDLKYVSKSMALILGFPKT